MLINFLSTNLPLAAVPITADGSEGGSYVLLIVYAVVAIGFSFFCSVAEAVLLSVTPSYIVTMNEKGSWAAKLLERLKEKIDRPLAAILSLNTIAHTVGAAGVGAEAAGVWGSSAVGYASAVMTLLILVLSEIIPKTIGATFWRSLAPSIAMLTQGLIWILYPLVWMSEMLTNVIAGGHRDEVVTREEVVAMAHLSAEGGDLIAGESTIIQNLFKLNALKVRDIMTPRTVIHAFNENLTVDEALNQQAELPVSRIPIYAENIDHVTGLVLKTDILLAKANDQPDTQLKDLRRSLHAIPEATSLFKLLEVLLEERTHFALVVDNYGGTQGVVTLEDLIETLLGAEIVDEADAVDDMQRLARKKWHSRAERLGLNLQDHAVNTPPKTDPPPETDKTP